MFGFYDELVVYTMAAFTLHDLHTEFIEYDINASEWGWDETLFERLEEITDRLQIIRPSVKPMMDHMNQYMNNLIEDSGMWNSEDIEDYASVLLQAIQSSDDINVLFTDVKNKYSLQ